MPPPARPSLHACKMPQDSSRGQTLFGQIGGTVTPWISSSCPDIFCQRVAHEFARSIWSAPRLAGALELGGRGSKHREQRGSKFTALHTLRERRPPSFVSVLPAS